MHETNCFSVNWAAQIIIQNLAVLPYLQTAQAELIATFQPLNTLNSHLFNPHKNFIPPASHKILARHFGGRYPRTKRFGCYMINRPQNCQKSEPFPSIRATKHLPAFVFRGGFRSGNDFLVSSIGFMIGRSKLSHLLYGRDTSYFKTLMLCSAFLSKGEIRIGEIFSFGRAGVPGVFYCSDKLGIICLLCGLFIAFRW